MDRNNNETAEITFEIGQARKSLWIETMPLLSFHLVCSGQARKSLWIETCCFVSLMFCLFGQARKSLWIETQRQLRS